MEEKGEKEAAVSCSSISDYYLFFWLLPFEKELNLSQIFFSLISSTNKLGWTEILENFVVFLAVFGIFLFPLILLGRPPVSSQDIFSISWATVHTQGTSNMILMSFVSHSYALLLAHLHGLKTLKHPPAFLSFLWGLLKASVRVEAWLHDDPRRWILPSLLVTSL